MKRIQEAVKARPLVILSGIILLCSIINLSRDEEPLMIVFFGACLVWWWIWAVFGLWRPLSMLRLIIAVFCTALLPFLCAGGVWVSMMAVLTVYLALFSIGIYLVTLLCVAVRNIYRWVYGKQVEPPTLEAVPETFAEVSGEASLPPCQDNATHNKVIPRRMLTVCICLGCVALAFAAMFAVDIVQRHSLVKQMQQPDIRYNMARRTLGLVLTYNEANIRDAQKVLLYTQPSGLTTEQSELLSEDVRVRLYVDCELRELPYDLHQMYLDEPTAFHIVLQPPQPAKREQFGERKGWLARGEAYIAGIEYNYSKETDSSEPHYLFGAVQSDRSNPADTYMLSRYYGENIKSSSPPTTMQQEQLSELYTTLPPLANPPFDPQTLPFELDPPPTAIISSQQNGFLTIGTPCPNKSCTSGHNSIELRWSNGIGGYTLDSLPDRSMGLWRGMGFYSSPLVATRIHAGSLPALLLSSEQSYSSQHQLLIQGSNGFYQLDMMHNPPSEYADESEKQEYKSWTGWIRSFVREFKEKEPRKD